MNELKRGPILALLEPGASLKQYTFLWSDANGNGNVDADEMARVFNMGIGMVLIVPKKHEAEVARKTGGRIIGEIVEGPRIVALI